MVLHLGTASAPYMDKIPINSEMKFQRADIHHLVTGCRYSQGRASSTSAWLRLLGYSNQPSQSKIIRKGNLYTKFNGLILTLTTWCRKIDRPFEISALAGSSCVSDLPQYLDQSCQFLRAGQGEECFSASLCQDMTVQLRKDQTARSWVTE